MSPALVEALTRDKASGTPARRIHWLLCARYLSVVHFCAVTRNDLPFITIFPFRLANPRHLSNAPITEALIDLRAAPAKGFSPDQLKSVSARLREEFPQAEERSVSEAQLEFAVGRPAKAVARDLGLRGVWLRTADEKEVAQFRVDGFTFSRLKPYTSWEDILPKALKLWKLYAEITQPDVVTRVAVRFINHLPLPEGSVELDDLILTAPRLPSGVPDELNFFSTRVVISDKHLRATVAQSLEVGVRSSQRTLLLDIDAFRIGDFDVEATALEPILADLREYKNEIFFGSLTEPFVKEFE